MWKKYWMWQGYAFPTVASIFFPNLGAQDVEELLRKQRRDEQEDVARTALLRRQASAPVSTARHQTPESVSRRRAHITSDPTTPSESGSDKTRRRSTGKSFSVSSPGVVDVEVDDYVLVLLTDEELMRWRRGRSQSRPAEVTFGAPTSSKPIPTVQEFDRKLAEADAYLQILIEQVSTLESRIDKFEDETQHQRQDALRDSAKAMIESIKQAIVLLQLAKNQLNPVNGLIQPDVDGLPQDGAGQVTGLQEGLQDRVSLAGSIASVDSASECLENAATNATAASTVASQGSARVAIPATKPRALSEQIPALSYSSSDDDDFFDADEYQDDMSPSQGAPGQAGGKMAKVEENDIIATADSDDEVLDCQEHGSVITHLLSQVRLGMDLTRVVLPTFILERRSLLEMYADFFAHPELFATISDLDDPKERMLQGLRWYLSAFHAGRKGSVAKKPYNPILGETFQCYWDLDETATDGTNQRNAADEELIQDGPVPWGNPDQVLYVAEQVSHHPPISAFYAEHVKKKMSFNAHIWTKSKFLGLSIGVEMVGQACVSDLVHEEEYIATFPNGYGRSILTIPWFEMGGKCSISCAKTGYSANIVFHTKPFYGGKRNRITAEVQHVSDRRPFLTIQGEWNGVMYCKGPDDQEERVFVDTSAMKINKKKVRPVEKQGEYESRRLWNDVTQNLKIKDIDKATDAKHFLEERQRQGARERKEAGTSWETKLFHEDGECWNYDNPLQRRIDNQAEQERLSFSATEAAANTTPSKTGTSGLAPSGPAAGDTAAANGTASPAKTPQQEVQDLLS